MENQREKMENEMDTGLKHGFINRKLAENYTTSSSASFIDGVIAHELVRDNNGNPPPKGNPPKGLRS